MSFRKVRNPAWLTKLTSILGGGLACWFLSPPFVTTLQFWIVFVGKTTQPVYLNITNNENVSRSQECFSCKVSTLPLLLSSPLFVAEKTLQGYKVHFIS